MRRPGPIAALTGLMLLAGSAATALGAAGGGSGGFGGGGGGGGFGGGGGGFGGGGGGFGGGGGTYVVGTADPGLILVIFLLIATFVIVQAIRQRRARRKMAGMRDPAQAAKRDRSTEKARRERVEKVTARSFVAAEDDPAFAADRVVPEAEALFRAVQAAWDARDVRTLETMVGPDLMAEWSRRLADFAAKGWHNRVAVDGPVRVEYVGITNLAGQDEDRVVVRVSALTQDYVVDRSGATVTLDGMTSRTAAIREYWTLARRGDRWILASIEQELEGEHQLRAQIIAEPSEDPRMADQSVVEMANQGRIDTARIVELADLHFEGSALTEARDMSLVDRRFDPNVIEASARRVVAAWAEAVDGADAALLEVADPEAVLEMLHPGDPSGRTRLVVRGPAVRSITIDGLDATRTPAGMDVSAEILGVWFFEDRDTTDVVSGDKDRAREFRQSWRLELTESADVPWKVVSAGMPAPH